MNVALGRVQTDAAAASFDLSRSTYVFKINAAAARRHLYFAIALPDFHAAATRFHGCALRSGLNHDSAAARLGDDFAIRVPYLD